MVAQGHNVGYHETDATYSSQRYTYGSSTSYSYPYYSYYGNSYYPYNSYYGNSYYPSYGNYGNSNYYYYG
uniref:Uncharacterized protein n=1 Tax=Acrobeloides nanus TaxID=290746 RepID=A0A914DW94_9BILA